MTITTDHELETRLCYGFRFWQINLIMTVVKEMQKSLAESELYLFISPVSTCVTKEGV